MMDKEKIKQELINASNRNSDEDLIEIAENMQLESKRELLIKYEMRIRSCSDEQAEIIVDSYLESTTI